MTYRAHLFSLRIGHALREACLGEEPYTLISLRRDLLAGLTVAKERGMTAPGVPAASSADAGQEG